MPACQKNSGMGPRCTPCALFLVDLSPGTCFLTSHISKTLQNPGPSTKSQVADPGTMSQDASQIPVFQISGPGSWMPGPGLEVPGPRYYMLGPRSLVPGPRTQVPRHRSQVPAPRFKSQVPSHRSQILVPRSEVPGLQVPGPRLHVSGPKFLVLRL